MFLKVLCYYKEDTGTGGAVNLFSREFVSQSATH